MKNMRKKTIQPSVPAYAGTGGCNKSLVIYTLTIQSECPTGKHKTSPKTIQTFTQLAVHFTARSLVSDYHYASLLDSSTQNHTTVNQNIQNDNTQLVHNPGQ